MALAEPLFTSQLYRENANMDTYIRLAFPNPFPISPSASLPRQPSSFHLHLTSRPSFTLCPNFVHKLFYSEIPPDRARLHFSASSLRPINSTGSFDFVPHIWQRTTEIFTNPCQVFEFRFRKDYDRNLKYLYMSRRIGKCERK